MRLQDGVGAAGDGDLVPILCAALSEHRAAAPTAGRALVVGVTGPQGSGKTTLAAALAERMRADGLKVAILALDDLYLPRADRLRLAAEVHPLLVTRGPPGTHDPALGAEILRALRAGSGALVPRFDKGSDDRLPPPAWTDLEGPFDLILFEGWCVGARPQPSGALAAPANSLERLEDPQGIWRRYVNEALAGPYRALFAPIGFQMLLLAPDFPTVLAWRSEQEKKLRAERPGAGQSDAELARFVQHYERLTRHVAREMPARADLVIRLGPDRRPVAVEPRPYSAIAE